MGENLALYTRTRAIHKTHTNTHAHTVSDRLTSDEQTFWLASSVLTWIRDREKKENKRDTTKEPRKVLSFK